MARRINTRFLIILTLVVGGLVVGLFAARQFLFKKDPDELVRSAEQKIAAGELNSAVYDLGGAINARPGDPELRIRLGDLYVMMKKEDGDWQRKALGAWNSALQVDPNYVPALERLLRVHRQRTQLAPRVAGGFTDLKEIAGRLAKVQPDNFYAAGLEQRAVIESWLNGHVVPIEEVHSAVEALRALIEKDPGSSEHPYWVARAMMQLSRDQSVARRQAVRDEALKLMEEALARNPDDASMHWRMGQLQSLAISLETDRDAREQRAQKVYAAMEKARELVKPDDPNLTEIMVTAAQTSLSRGQVEEAATTLQALVDARPWDPGIRLRQARLLAMDPKRVDEAIKGLEQPVQPREGIDWDNLLTDYENERLVLLVDLKIRRLYSIPDMAERQKEAEKIELERQALVRRLGELPVVIVFKGELHLAQRQLREAITAFEEARTAMRGQGIDADLMTKLAAAYFEVGQIGSAKELWQDILRTHPEHVPSRLRLAEALLRENNIEDAERQLRMLEELGTPPQQTAGLRAAIAMRKKDGEGTEQAFEAIPEETREQMLRKALLAIQYGNRGEAIRLMEAARKLESSPELLEDLAKIYMAEKQPDKAREMLEEALAVAPDRSSAKILLAAINQAKPEELEAIQREAIAKTDDPFLRELQLFELARQHNRLEEALQHLHNAEKIKPDDPSVKERMLAIALQQRDWEKAEAYVNELAAANRDQANGAVYRFQLEMARGNRDKAAEYALEASAKLTHFARGSLVLAQARHAQGRLEEAITHYRRALDKQSNNADALRGLLACHNALKNVAAAEAVIREARRVLPNDPYFIEAELDHKEQYGDPAEVLPARLAAVERNPKDRRAVADLGQAYQKAANYALEKRNDERKRREYLQAALKTYRNAAETWPDELSFFGAIADVQLAMNDVAGAEKTLREAADRDGWRDRPEPHSMLAQLFARTGRLSDAEGQLREAVIKSSGSLPARLQLVNFLAHTGRLDLALEELNHADQKSPAVQRTRVDLLLAAGAIEPAEKALKEAIASNPGEPELKTSLASLYAFTNRLDEGLKTANEVLQEYPDNLGALVVRGRIRLAQGAVDEAIADLSRVTAAQKNNVEAQTTLADAYRRKNNTDAAIAALEAALTEQPLNKGVRLQLLSLLSDAQPPRWSQVEILLRDTRQMPQYQNDPDWALVEAQMWRRRGQMSRALESIQAGLKLAPDSPILLDNYFQILLANRDYGRVLSESERLVKGEKPAWWAYHARALARKGRGDKTEALAEYERALATDDAVQNPGITAQLIQSLGREIGTDEAIRRMGDRVKTDPTWKLLAVQLYHNASDYPAAIALLEELDAARDSLNPAQKRQFLQLAGVIYSSAKPLPDPDKAHLAYLDLLEMNPNDVQALNNVACLLVDTKRPADPVGAAGYSQRAMDLMIQQGRLEPLIQDTHGWVLTHLPNRMAEGILLLQQVVASNPQFPEAYYHLGDAYLRDKQPQRAIDPLTRAQQMLNDAIAKGQPVDPDLKARVDQALIQAQGQLNAAAN